MNAIEAATDGGAGDGWAGKNAGDPGDLAEDAFAHILQIMRVVQGGMQLLESRHGLSGAQLCALWQLSAHPGLRVTELAARLFVQHSTASNLLDKLEDRRLVRRARSSEDQRTVNVFLTARGKAVVRELPGPLHGRLRNILQRLSDARLRGIRDGIAEVLELMDERKEPPAGRSTKGGARNKEG